MPQEEKTEATVTSIDRPIQSARTTSATTRSASKRSGSSAGSRMPSLYAAEPNSTKKKYYVLEMLPYPSGALHMGHVRNYSIGDALARYMWMNGYNVLHPMGWDSFGLPAENAAIQNNTPPREWTLRNIANMKAQMKRLGFAYDWSREVTTCFPEYYRWNQWFFLKLYEQGLAYRKKSKVNWCPKCATVLANEQVCRTAAAGGTKTRWSSSASWSSGSCAPPSMPTNCCAISTSWRAGRKKSAPCSATGSGAAKARWSISNSTRRPCRRRPGSTITVFTTRVDTIFGATSVQLAPEHPMVADLHALRTSRLRAKVEQLIAEQRKAKEAGDIGEIEKHGVNTGRYAINPFNGERVPDLGGELHPDGLRHGRDHERAGARRARLRVRQEVQARNPAGHFADVERSRRDHGRACSCRLRARRAC